jgi:hypothetical protein
LSMLPLSCVAWTFFSLSPFASFLTPSSLAPSPLAFAVLFRSLLSCSPISLVLAVFAHLHCCYKIVTLLLHCCYTVVTILLHSYYTVLLLLHWWYTVVTVCLLRRSLSQINPGAQGAWWLPQHHLGPTDSHTRM